MVLIAALGAASCGAVPETVSPMAPPTALKADAAKADGREVCIIENPRVRTSFLEAYKTALEEKGYAVRVLPRYSQLSSCPTTSQYSAIWGFDTIASYLRYADIRVYNNAELADRASYNGNSFIDAEQKVRELVGKLFSR